MACPGLSGQSGLQYVPDFLFHGQTVSCSAKTQAGFEVVVKVSDGDAAQVGISKYDFNDCIVIILFFRKIVFVRCCLQAMIYGLQLG